MTGPITIDIPHELGLAGARRKLEGSAEKIAGFVPGHRSVDASEAKAWAAELRELGARGEYFFSINRYAFGAVKR